MSFQADSTDPLAPFVNALKPKPDNETQRELQPLHSTKDEPINAYDDLIAWFMDNALYKGIVLLFMMQSNSVLVFLRYRIGRRIMRGWIFQMLFILLMCGSGLGVFFTHDSIDVPLALYALLMAVLATYHHSVGKELTEVTDPDLMLHTLSRGDSHLMLLMRIMPRITIPVYLFYQRRFKAVRIFPLGEPTVQRVLEPILLMVLAMYFSFWQPSLLGSWLAISSITLVVVESDYHTRALNAALDQFDSRIEARVMREVQAAYSQGHKPARSKMNGISVATASEQMVRLAQLNQQAR